jgi:parallel beta-helix repeat protein
MKTLDEVEPRIPISQSDIPFTINESGSYYLTEDINSADTAITVAADDVTIDLAGFTLAGPDSGTIYGIYMSGRSNVEIRNGTVRDFHSGIYESSDSGQGHRVIDVRALSNGIRGIYLGSKNNLVKDCTASGNGTSATGYVYGIYASSGSTVTGNTVRDNGNSATSYVYGIYAYTGSTVTGNTAYYNGTSATGSYVYGIKAGSGSTVTGNTAYYNGNWADGDVVGIYAGSGSTVTGNTAYNNGYSADTVYGIWLGGYNLVDQNTAYSNGSAAGSATNMTLGVTGCNYVENVAP